MLLGIAGCRSSPPTNIEVDAKVVRYSEAGAEELAEGRPEDASQEFRKALYRAWAIDDPVEGGTQAYNLAAVLFSQGELAEASRWLVDARAGLHRGGASLGNTYLLEAKIAEAESRYEDATTLVDRAACSPPPCGDNRTLPCGLDEACREPVLACVPRLGNQLVERQADQQCRIDYQAQVHLARARIAIDQFDVASASAHLAKACELASEVCSFDLQAELQHVAARIDLARGRFLQAARHFDREATWLRYAGNYRKLPDVLRLSAAALQQIDQFDATAQRLLRVARIWLGRGDATKSWETLREAAEWSELEPREATRIRLELTATEIDRLLNEVSTETETESETESETETETETYPAIDNLFRSPANTGMLGDDVLTLDSP